MSPTLLYRRNKKCKSTLSLPSSSVWLHHFKKKATDTVNWKILYFKFISASLRSFHISWNKETSQQSCCSESYSLQHRTNSAEITRQVAGSQCIKNFIGLNSNLCMCERKNPRESMEFEYNKMMTNFTGITLNLCSCSSEQNFSPISLITNNITSFLCSCFSRYLHTCNSKNI